MIDQAPFCGHGRQYLVNILLSGNIFKYFSVLLRKLQYEAPRKYLQYLQVLPSKIVQCEARGIIWAASACLSGRRGQCSGKDRMLMRITLVMMKMAKTVSTMMTMTMTTMMMVVVVGGSDMEGSAQEGETGKDAS